MPPWAGVYTPHTPPGRPKSRVVRRLHTKRGTPERKTSKLVGTDANARPLVRSPATEAISAMLVTNTQGVWQGRRVCRGGEAADIVEKL